MKIAIVARPFKRLPTDEHTAWAPGIIMAAASQGLVKAGHDVRVYAAKGSQVSGELIDFDMPPFTEVRHDLPDTQVEIRRVFYTNLFLKKVINHLRKNAVEVIHLNDYRDYPIFEAANLDIPIVCTLHGDYVFNFEGSPQVIKDQLVKMNIISATQPKELKNLPEPFAVVPNMFNTEEFPLIKNPQDKIVYVGRVTEGKGADLVINLAEKICRRITIYGAQFNSDDFKKDFLKRVSSKYIDYQGALPHERIKKAYDGKVMVFPMRVPEGFPTAVIEAMSCGTPVVTFDVGGMSQVVKNGVSGFVVPAGDLDAMSEKIEKAEKLDRELVRQYVASNFSQEVAAEKLIAAFKKAII